MRLIVSVLLFVLCLWVISAHSGIYTTERCKADRCENFVRIAIDGVGDLLIFPLFYLDPQSNTKIIVVNTSERFGVVAQVTIKSVLCSEVLANFYIFLSPLDSWIGYLKMEKNKAALVSYDDSSLVGNSVATLEDPMIINFNKLQNPEDLDAVGYIEVKTIAYVDTYYVDPEDNERDYNLIMREQGFTEEHLFMNWLFGSKENSYNEIAYFSDNSTNSTYFTGIIFPPDEHKDFYKYNPVVVKIDKWELLNRDIEDGMLMGRAEIIIGNLGKASYTAVAIKDYIMLGDDSIGDYNYDESYKPSLDDGVYLDNVGYIEFLDSALAKKKVIFPYEIGNNETAFMFLLFPTKQLSYDSVTKKCIATDHTSSVWHEGKVLEQQGIDVVSFSPNGEIRKCAFFPCVWYDTAMFVIGKTNFGFDPFFYKSGWVEVLFSSQDKDLIEFSSVYGKLEVSWKDIKSLPVIVLAGVIGNSKFSLDYPSCELPWGLAYSINAVFQPDSRFYTEWDILDPP